MTSLPARLAMSSLLPRPALRALLLGAVLAGSAPAHAVDADAAAGLYQQSYDLEAAGNYRGALARMDDLEQQGEQTYVLALRRAWLMYRLGRYADSAKAYRVAIERKPGSVEARQGLALPLMALRDWGEAEKVCRDLLSRAPRDKTGRSRLAYILYSTGKYGESAREYAQVLEDHPSDTELRAGLGWARLKEGDVKGARAAFEGVLRVHPANVSAQQGIEGAR
jgi:tetratricopeptide (TPR) repeat protein